MSARSAFLLALVAAVVLPWLALSQGLTSHTFINQNSGTFAVGAVTGSIAVSNRTNVSSASGLMNSTPATGNNFPGAWYSPSTPVLTNFQRFELNNASSAGTGSYTLTYTFNTPVTDPVFYFYNVDAGTFNFSGTTQVGGGAVSLTKVSGNSELELSGTVVNSTPRSAANTGCEANDGSNGQGGCGSIRLNGSYQTVTFVATDTVTSTGSGDGHGIALFVQSDYGDAPSSYGAAAHSGGAAVRLGALRDVEGANQPSATATLDDTTGSDDEDALASVTSVTLTAGATHTQSGIGCSGSGSLYGYIDFNRDGDFTDANERSSLSACSGGTASLSWTLPAAGSLVAGGSFLRIRYASDSTQIDSPSENAATGEVEDYAVTLVSVALPSADFAVTKSDGVGSVTSGGSTTYTIVVTNNGPSTVSGAVLTDPIAMGLIKTGVACAATPGQCTGGTTPTIGQLEAGYALPSLSSGQSYRLSVTATVTASSGGSVSNSATIAVPAGTTDGTGGNNSATDTNSVTRVAGTPPTLSCPNGTSVHDWDTAAWANGSTSNTYNIPNIGTTSFSVAISGGTWVNSATYGGQSPNLQTVVTGGFSPAQRSLLYYVDFTSLAGTATTTITLPTAVPGLQFRLFDVDFTSGAWAERVTVTGSLAGSPVAATLTNSVANYVVGNTAFGDISASESTSQGTVVVTFSSPVDTVVVTLGNHALAPSNPSSHGITFHDITFCRPGGTLSVTKVSSVLSDGVSASNPKAIPGATIRYCITATNNSGGTITNVVATDILPPEVTYIAGSLSSGGSCSGSMGSEDDDASGGDETDPFGMRIVGSAVTGTAASLAPAASFAMAFNVTVN